MNNSSTGGYIQPVPQFPAPVNRLNLVQFIQTVLVGVSNLPAELVRPKWQPAPPKQPDIDTNWMAFGIAETVPDANSFLGMDADGAMHSQRHEGLSIACTTYGPNSLEICDLIRDGFQIPQNRDALARANMGFTDVSRAIAMPEVINERWFQRYDMVIVLRRQVNRDYPIVSILSANGTIHTVLGNESYLLDWATAT